MNDERLKLLAGQRLVAGFEGYTVPESFQKLIRDCKIGNVILFRRNIRSCACFCTASFAWKQGFRR